MFVCDFVAQLKTKITCDKTSFVLFRVIHIQSYISECHDAYKDHDLFGKSRLHNNESAQRSLSAGDHKATRNSKDTHEIQTTKRIHKSSIALKRSEKKTH